MITNLDNRTTKEEKLFGEIQHLLVHLELGTNIIVYLPNEGPIAYSYKDYDGTIVKGVFTGDYTKKTLKNFVRTVAKGKYSFLKVSSQSLFSYKFWLEDE